MPTFEPVDYDPFGAATPTTPPASAPVQPAPQPVAPVPAQPVPTPAPAMADADPSSGRPLTIRGKAPTYTPVDYDPFASQASAPSWLDTAKDVAAGGASGIERGIIATATLPATIEHYARAGFNGAYDGIASHVFGAAPPDKSFSPDLSDTVSVQGAERGLDAMGIPLYEPQTTAGKYAETMGEFVPGGIRRGAAGLGNVIKNVVVPGIASEGAGQLTQGTTLEPYARFLAPIVAGGAVHIASGPGSASKVLSDAAGALDPTTLDAAQTLMDSAARQGSPLSLAEAVQQVTNSGTRLGSLQRVVEQSRGGADPMAKFYADRPQQVQQAGNAAIDRIGTLPAVPVDGSIGPVQPNAASVGPLVQDAAQGAVAASPQGQQAAAAVTAAGPRITPEQAGNVIQPGLRQVYDQRLDARSAQARQDFGAAAIDNVPAEHVQTVLDTIDRQIAADKTGLLAEQLAPVRNRLIDRTPAANPQWEIDPVGPDGIGPPMPMDHDAYSPAPRPSVPRPQTLQDFVKQAGGVQDPRGDLKSMGLDRVPGLIAKPGKGLGPDAMRQIAAEQGYLGAHIDDAMANTSINDLYDALGNHPVTSVRDAHAVDAWHAYDFSRSDAEQAARPEGPPSSTPGPYPADYGGLASPPPKPVVPITDIENLNRTRKFFRDRIDRPQIDPRSIDKETAAKIGSILGDLDAVMQDGSPAYRKANQNFAANSVPLQPFENTPGIATAIERDPYGTRFTTPADRVPGLIEDGGPSGSRAFNSVAPDPVRQVFERHLTTRILDQATGPNGALDADRLTQTLRANADQLQQHPAVAQRVQRIIDTQRALAPMADTMVGRLAATPAFREQASIILGPNPVPGSASEVADAVRQVAARNPQAAQALVAQQVRQTFNEATQSNMAGPNQGGGAKFNAVIRGNTQQARNLKAAVEALHGPGTWRDFQQTLDVFESMGRRQAPGSMTEFNRQFSKEMQRGSLAGEVASTAAAPSEWLSKARGIYEGWRYGRNTEALADMLTRPDAAKRLAAIARAKPGSSASQGMAAAYLLGNATNQGARERRGSPPPAPPRSSGGIFDKLLTPAGARP